MRAPSEEHNAPTPTSIGAAFVTQVCTTVAVNDVDNLCGEILPSSL